MIPLHRRKRPAYFDVVANEYIDAPLRQFNEVLYDHQYELDAPFRQEDFEAFLEAFKAGELDQADYADDLASCVAAGRIPHRMSHVGVRR
jgi:hypothetical protein